IGEPHTEALEEPVDKGGDLVYSLNDRPPWYLCILLGFQLQHYILAFGGIIAIPLILAEPLCIKDNNAAKSQLISTIFLVSGLCTLMQTAIGTLPILQGGTFSFITPTLAILALPKWQCPAPKAPGILSTPLQNSTSPLQMEDSDEVWMSRMREIQGAILVSSLLQIILGFSGLVGLVLKFIGPLAIAPTINLIGLSLFIEAGKKCGGHWGIAATVGLILLFSQYLSKVDVPMIAYKDKKWKVFQYPLFKLFSALFGMCGGWLVCFLLTIFDVLPSKSDEYGYSARTDISLEAVTNSPWFHVPYPQWGMPTVSVSSVLGMMAGVLASTMESIGDYYACARLSGAPPPPTHAINRGIAVEGIGCILAALWGTGNGTTSYSQNIAALGITKQVGSRLVLQTTGILMVVLGIFGKFGAVFITIPDPVIGGMFLVMFGMIAAVGISNLQYVDLNSSRNLLILGFSTFSGLVLPSWFHSNPGIIDTIQELDQVIVVLFTTHMFIGGFFGFILDNTIP
uniref:Si:dkey-106n21.1 n=1 Tax=Seriola lalandi dorsalis TaxID=1841481 RepID=A0A3B4X274_SERLL